MKYIDISEWQGTIDWQKVKGNVDGVIIRAGYGKGNVDAQFNRNAKMCNSLKIPCGAYWFSYAKNADEAKLEAVHLLNLVAPYQMELPLAFDFEYDSVKSANKAGVTVTKQLASDMVRAFCNTIEAAGYWCLNYANPDFLSRYFDDHVASRYGLWLAQWPSKVDVSKPPRKCAIWQWGGSEVPGIVGNVDTNESYTDFCKIIRESGCNNLSKNQTPVESNTKPTTNDAVAWAKSFKITENEEIAKAIYNYHNAFVAQKDEKTKA